MSNKERETANAEAKLEPTANALEESAAAANASVHAKSTSRANAPAGSAAAANAGAAAQRSGLAADSSSDAPAKQAKADALPSARAMRIHARRAFTLGVVVVCLVAMTFGMRLTYSAFTAGDYLKGVVVTNDTQSLFASDLLYPYSDTTTVAADQVIAIEPDDDGNCYVAFSIYNRLPADRTVVNMKDVVYNLSIVAQGCGNDWSVSPSLPTEVTLRGGRAQTDTFTIKFPAKYLGQANFSVTAEVVSDKSPGTTLKRLAARIVPNERVNVENVTVEGALVDRYITDAQGNKTETTVADYAAYNYRITVTGKETKVKLTWNASVVDLDHFFDERFSAKEYDLDINRNSGEATLTLQPGNTVVNFFRHNGAEIANWESLGLNVAEVAQE